MKIEKVIHTDVEPSGTLKNELGAAVYVDGFVSMSHENGGCGFSDCSCSPGYWLSIVEPRDPKTKTVSGLKVTFDNEIEMTNFLTLRELNMGTKA